MRYKIGETVHVFRGGKGKIVDYSEASHRYKVKVGTNQYILIKDCDIKEVDEPWRKK
jgi:hypothetical protein